MNRGFSAIGLVRPKDGSNIGGALRAAHCYGAGLVVLDRPRWIKHPTNTTAAHRHIPVVATDDILDARPYDCPMVVVEIIDGATSLPDFRHPERAFYVFGPEDGSVPKNIVEQAQHVVSIPTAFCMNLAVTVNVVLYDRMAKSR